MLYTHEIDDWTPFGSANIEIQGRAETAAKVIAEQIGAQKLPPLNIVQGTNDLVSAGKLAEKIKASADHVLVMGIGGSSLGAQALSQIVDYYTPAAAVRSYRPQVYFLESPDGQSLSALLSSLPLERTHSLIISKSGGTAESMMQGLSVIGALQAAGLGDKVGDLVSVITEPRDNALSALADEYGLSRVDHPTDIGGRFSVLSAVGLTPALIMGLDAKEIRAGANAVVSAFVENPTSHNATTGAVFCETCVATGRRVQILMPYSDRLERFAMWYRQLWAESLGKDGKGSLPVRAMGPVDQHSQLQLYLDGPDDYAMTVLSQNQSGLGPQVHEGSTSIDALSYLKGHSVGDLVMAEARATFETFKGRGRPVRAMSVEKVDEASVGALMAHYMLETVITAEISGVNAYDQPAVEEGKILARKYLAEMKK